MQTTKQASVVDTIDNMLASIDARVGAEKTAEESNTEAGGYQGPTTHPVKDEDDRTEDAQEGARSQENSEDVKADQGSPSVDSTPEKAAARKKQALGDQDKVQLNIGTEQSATGEDSKVETDSAKDGKEDGGYQGASTHPARTDNEELDGHKYAGSINQLRAAIKQASDVGNDALAAISVESHDEIKKQAQSQLKERGQDPEKIAAAQGGNKSSAKQAGADLADAVAGTGQVDGHDKQAQSAQVIEDLAQTILTAYSMADKTAEFLGGYFEAVSENQKQAQGKRRSDFPKASAEKASMTPEDTADAPEDSSDEGDDEGDDEGESPAEGGGDPMMGGGEELPPEGGDEAALLEALLGGGMPPEGGGDPMMGGMPPEGGDPMMGGMPPEGGDVPGAEDAMAGMAGGMPPEQGGDDEMAMLQAALAEAGIPPEALEATAAAKAARDLKAYRAKQASSGERKSDWRPKSAEQAKRYQATLNYIKELCGSQ